jgi:uncharacterized metal-binding protein
VHKSETNAETGDEHSARTYALVMRMLMRQTQIKEMNMTGIKDIANNINAAKLLLKEASLDLENLIIGLDESEHDYLFALSDILEEALSLVSAAKERAINKVPDFEVDPETDYIFLPND